MFFCYLCMTAIVSDSLMNKTITPNEYRQELRLRLLRVAMREFRRGHQGSEDGRYREHSLGVQTHDVRDF